MLRLLSAFVLAFTLPLSAHAQMSMSSDGTNLTFKSGSTVVAKVTPSGGVEANKHVEVGTSTASCTSSLAGAIRYNSTDKKLEFCNGTAWGAL